jgi:hypothetical protein
MTLFRLQLEWVPLPRQCLADNRFLRVSRGATSIVCSWIRHYTIRSGARIQERCILCTHLPALAQFSLTSFSISCTNLLPMHARSQIRGFHLSHLVPNAVVQISSNSHSVIINARARPPHKLPGCCEQSTPLCYCAAPHPSARCMPPAHCLQIDRGQSCRPCMQTA